jgi:hypothetical protein
MGLNLDGVKAAGVESVAETGDDRVEPETLSPVVFAAYGCS